VEPSAVCRRILEANVRLAGGTDWVTVLAAAVGAADGVLPMLTTGAGGDHFLVAAQAGRADTRPVTQVTLDRLGAESARPITHVKVDVEGFEAEVLAGGREFLRARQPRLFLELHGELLRQRGQSPEGLLALLGECGYRRLEQDGRPVTPREAAACAIARLVCVPAGATAEGGL
jgi:FkbM family methyltransferase